MVTLKQIEKEAKEEYNKMYGGKYDGWVCITSKSDFDNVVETTNYLLVSNYINYTTLMDRMCIIKVEED